MKNGRKAFVSILLEHKSHPDKNTSVQILHYLASGYYNQIKQNGKINLIISMVFYHGKEKWVLKSLTELMKDTPEELKKFIPTFEIQFIDLKIFSDKELELLGNAMLYSFLILQKYSDQPSEIENKIKLIFNKLDSVRNRNYLRIIVVYILNTIKKEIIMDLIDQTSQLVQDEFESAYETFRKEGYKEGIEKEKIEVIRRGWDNGYDIKDLSILTGISEKKIREIIGK